MRLELAFEELLPHPVEAVWRALTDAESISEWLMKTDDFEPEVGARFRMRKPPSAERDVVEAEVLELEPPRRMVWAWIVEEGSAPTVVTFELTPEAESTRLRLTHVGEIDPLTAAQLTGGWPGKLDSLRSSLADEPGTGGHPVVGHGDWLEARKALLAQEKELTRLRDRLSRARRELPWERVEKEYVFRGPDGEETLLDLFDGRSQLVVYHFMFDPEDEWAAACKHCSFWADNFDPIIVHLNARDVTMVAVSRAQLEKIDRYRARMGWQFKWLSSHDGDFNYDLGVSFQPDELESAVFNYGTLAPGRRDREGVSVFVRDGDRIFHTYSTYGRGIDMLNTAYHYLDLVPRGRGEDGQPPQYWVRRHDEYDSATGE